MRTSFRTTAPASLVLTLALLGVASEARADGMDVSLARLTRDNDITDLVNSTTGAPEGPGRRCGDFATVCADNQAWDALLQQLAVSMAPPILTPAGTLGPGGFSMSYEGWITGIASDRDFWKRGTEGTAAERVIGATTNGFTSTPFYWHRINIRKAFPFGFQLGTNLGQLLGTSYFTAGLEIQWSIFEGMRRWGWLPDLAVRGAVQVLFGETEFDLTVPTVDVILSKPITVGNVGTITPFAAAQVLFILGDSELVDLTPNVDSHTSPMDSYNNAVFAQIRKNRVRGTIGVQARFGWFMLTAAFAFDATSAVLRAPQEDGLAPTSATNIRALPGQFSGNFGVGAAF